MTIEPGPYDLEATRLVLGPQGNATAKAVTPGFYDELDTEFGGFSGHVLVSKHEFVEAWPGWEMHPKGDEIVTLMSGDIDFVLWTGQGEEIVRVSEPGTAIVVPKGTWHTARPRTRTAMLFFTPGEGTQLADTPPGAN